MKAIQLLVAVLWVLIVAITWRAITELGSAGGLVFLSDFLQPWRAQFNTDLSIHLLLFAVWVCWREKSKLPGLLLALLCAMGGLFTLAYLSVALYRSKGDARALLLGAHADRS